jgi:hypothetical protein
MIRAIALVITLMGCLPANAIPILVSMDSSALSATGNQYILDFQLIGTAGSSAVLDRFDYDTGTGPFGPFGLDTNTVFVNEVLINWSPGNLLRFQLDFHSVPPAPSGFPDEFSFFILDSSFTPLPTTDAGSAFLVADLGTGAPLQLFAGTSSPTITDLSVIAAPEPAAAGLVFAGLAVLVCWPLRCWRT